MIEATHDEKAMQRAIIIAVSDRSLGTVGIKQKMEEKAIELGYKNHDDFLTGLKERFPLHLKFVKAMLEKVTVSHDWLWNHD